MDDGVEGVGMYLRGFYIMKLHFSEESVRHSFVRGFVLNGTLSRDFQVCRKM